MAELSVAIIAAENDQQTVLQALVDATNVARTVMATSSYPLTSTDPITRKIHAMQPDVVLVDIPIGNPASALRGIELLHQEMPAASVFAIGSMTQAQTIVSAMRAGAREYVERPASTTDLLEAFVRLAASQRKSRGEGQQGSVYSIVGAKGGSGATTIAVNTALALQAAHGATALVDLGTLGHTALHLNLKPLFTVNDAVRNLHRLDHALLESFITQHASGLHVLAGVTTPGSVEPTTADYARLFEMLTHHYQHVVVDVSSRLDAATRLVCNLSDYVVLVTQTDVASLWSASRMVQYLGEAGGRDHVRLLFNRYRKIPGFGDREAEAATGAKVIWKIPNQYAAASAAVDAGKPLMDQSSSEIAKAFQGLAAELTRAQTQPKPSGWSIFRNTFSQ